MAESMDKLLNTQSFAGIVKVRGVLLDKSAIDNCPICPGSQFPTT